jgi:hypothetical protein
MRYLYLREVCRPWEKFSMLIKTCASLHSSPTLARFYRDMKELLRKFDY